MNGYIALWRGKKIEVFANTTFEAQQKVANRLKIKRSYEITVVLAEKDGQPVIHSTASL